MSTSEIVDRSNASAVVTRLRIICVGTGWGSEKGGLSTINRYLALALKRLNHEVICIVDAYSDAEFNDAAACGVHLKTYGEVISSQDTPADVVIGHSRITGPKAVEIARVHGCRRIHFIHTRSELIPHIRGVFPKSMEKADADKKSELDLCNSADLVAAVGPLLQRHTTTATRRTVYNFLPGLPTEFHDWAPVRVPPPERQCLMLGRASDASIKGFDIGAAAVSRVESSPEHGAPLAVIRGVQDSDRKSIRLIESAMHPSAQKSRLILRPLSGNELEIFNDIRSSAVMLIPSREEGFGLAGLEALAAGIPILISSRSGLAAYLEKINAHRGYVVPVCDDIETNINTWTSALTAVLENLEGAFQKTDNLRIILERELSWTRSARELLENLDLKAQETSHASVSSYVETAIFLSRPLDVEAVNRSAKMIQALSENVPDNRPLSEDLIASASDALVQQSINAYRSDTDVASQIETALLILRTKYSGLNFRPAECRSEIQAWRHSMSPSVHDEITLERLRRYQALANVVARDIAAIPRDALDYAVRHGLRMHNAVVSGEAIVFAGFGCPEVGRPVYDYALENLERIFEAGANLVTLNPQVLRQGYLTNGKASANEVAPVVALALRESFDRATISIMSQTKDEKGLTDDARFVARTAAAETMRFIGRKLGASSQDFLYRWGFSGPTPEMEWKVRPGERVARWCVAVHESEIWHVFIESDDGSGYAYHERNLVGTWKVPTVRMTWPGSAAMWCNHQNTLYRVYSLEPGVIVLFRGLDVDKICASVNVLESLAPQFYNILKPENYTLGMRNPYRIEVGRFGGRTCLAVCCILDPGANAVFFLDAYNLTVLRPPLICRSYFEEIRLLEAGSKSFFIATLMRGSGHAFAAWDVTDGSGGEEDPISTCCPSAAGGVLDCSQTDGGFNAWFTVRALPLGSARPELWRWQYPHNVCDKMLVLSEGYIFALAASS